MADVITTWEFLYLRLSKEANIEIIFQDQSYHWLFEKFGTITTHHQKYEANKMAGKSSQKTSRTHSKVQSVFFGETLFDFQGKKLGICENHTQLRCNNFIGMKIQNKLFNCFFTP